MTSSTQNKFKQLLANLFILCPPEANEFWILVRQPADGFFFCSRKHY